MRVLVDTSVWSLALRRRTNDLNHRESLLVRELAELVQEGRAGMIGVIRQELLSGINSGAQFEDLRKTLRAFPDEPLGIEDYEAAARGSNTCRAKGIAATIVDMLICAVAHQGGMSIFTTDPDFENYARCLPVKLHFVRDDAGPRD